MAEPKVQTSFWIRFDLKKISDGSTLTVRFGDFDYATEDDVPLWSGFGDMYGGLIDIQGFAYEVGYPLPTRSGGSITLDATRGVYRDRNTRITDLIKDYYWLNAPVIVNSFKKTPDSIGSSGDVRIEFNGVVKDLSYNIEQQTFTINVEPTQIPTDFKMLSLYDGRSIFSSVPANQYGKIFPLIFGSATVPTSYVGDSVAIGADSPSYAYATAPSGYRNSGVTNYFIKNYLGEYIEVQSAASVSTQVYGSKASDGTTRMMIAPDNDAATPATSRAWREYFTVSTNYLVTNGNVDTQEALGASTTYYMNFYIKIYVSETTGNQIEETLLGTGTISMDGETYTANQQKTKSFSFDKPIVFETGKSYFIEFSIAGNQNQVADYKLLLRRYLTVTKKVYRLQGNANQWDLWSTTEGFDWYLFGVKFNDVVSSAGPLINYFYLTQQSAASGQVNPSLTNLSFIVTASGVIDDGSGTITGTANALINDPYEITRLLLNNSAALDVSTYNAAALVRTILPRTINGFTKNRQNTSTILGNILKQSSCILVPRNDGLSTKSWALYPYGFRTSAIRYLSEQQVKLINFKQYGQASIVNRVDIAYDETSLPLNTQDLQSGFPKNFKKSYVAKSSDGGDVQMWTQESVARFGEKTNDVGFDQLDWAGDTLTSTVYAYYYYLLTSFSRPLITVEMELPFFDEDYRTIQCMDVIELSHPDMPSTFGTSPDSLTEPPVYSGAIVETANFGFPLRQAQIYRLQVIKRQVIFNISANRAPALRVVARLLWNPYEVY
jgi:hypothetical protein